MDKEEILQSLKIAFAVTLALAWIFSIKSCADHRSGYASVKELQKTQEKIESGSASREEQFALFDRQAELTRKIQERYGFPKVFFIAFIILLSISALWTLALSSRLPSPSRERSRNSLRLVVTMIALLVVLLFFFLIEYHKISSSLWFTVAVIFQWLLLAAAAALALSDKLYAKLAEFARDKDLIEGEPPPAW